MKNLIKLSNSELKRLTIVLDNLENEARQPYKRINGGFARTNLFSYDNNIIDIELVFGTQDDSGSYVNTEQYKVDRKTMTIIN